MKAYGLARLGSDAELRFTQNNDAVCSLRLAFSYGKKDSSGNRPTQWVDASLWGTRAESLQPHLTKGTLILVSLDEVRIETYQGKNGEGHKMAARVVDLEFAGGGQRQEEAPQRPAQSRAPARPQQGGQRMVNNDDLDSEIPF